MEFDEEEDYENGEEDNGMLLAINDKGELAIHNPDDYVEVPKKDMELIQGFIKEHQEAFTKYCKENTE